MSGPPSGAFDLVGEILAGKYRIDRHLGRGGMGIVYAATQLELSRKVAVKVLTTSGGDLDALGREARAAAQLAHPHIVQVTDFVGPRDQGDDPPFLVMELLEGESLDERLSKKKRLPADAAVQIAIQVLSALEAAHAAGIVHRDVKPANVFLTRTAVTYDFVKLLDFGVARVGAGSSIASLNARGPIGTPAYMAPEQIAEGRADARTDVYAVGVCLYEMLAGEPPFLAANVPSLLQKICSADAAPLSQRGTGAEDALLAIIEKAMSKDPKARFASAEELRAALVPFAHAVAVPSRNIAGVASERATLRATSESSTTLEASPVEAEPPAADEKLVDAPAPAPRPRLSGDADRTIRSSEPQNPTLASHDPLTTTPAVQPDLARASAAWPLVALAAILAVAWMLPPAAPHRTTPAAAASASSVVAAHPADGAGPCRIESTIAPYPTHFLAHLAVAASGNTVAISGQDVGAGPFAAIARRDEKRFYPKALMGLATDGDVTVLAARDRVGFLYAHALPEPDRMGAESVVAVFDEEDEWTKGTPTPLSAAARIDYRVDWFDAVGNNGLVLFAAGGAARPWIKQVRRTLGPHAVITRSAPQAVYLTNLDADPARTWEVATKEEPTLLHAFAARSTRGVAYKTATIAIDVLDTADGPPRRALLPDSEQASELGVGANAELATVAWMDAHSEGPLHVAVVGALAAVITREDVLAGQKIITFALGNSRAGLVFAWLTHDDSERRLLHAGIGGSIREAIARAGTVEVQPAHAVTLAVGLGESEPVVHWSEQIEEHPGSAVRVAGIACE